MRSHLRGKFPEHELTRSEPTLDSMIAAGIDRASGYGIVMEDDVRRFLEYLVLYGPEADRDPKLLRLTAILADPDLTGSEKMRRIDVWDQFRR